MNARTVEFPEEPQIPTPEEPHPQVFVRAFSVPAAMPWEQTKAAQLEARHGAPLPIAEVMHRFRRLGSWSPGRAGRFAVFYIRRREYKQAFETVVEVDGEPIKVAFGAGGAQLQRAQSGLIYTALIGALVLVLVGGAAAALKARSAAAAQADAVEQALEAKARMAAGLTRQREYARALRTAAGRAAPVGDVLADVAWATSVRNPDAKVMALHWDHGFLAAETRGATAPFEVPPEALEKSERPIRSGIWLWGVQSSALSAQAAASAGGRP